MISTNLALVAALLLVAPVGAQSPDPSAAPPVAAPSEAAAAPSGFEAIEAGFAAQACEPFLSAEVLTTNAGITVTGISGGRLSPFSSRPGFIRIDCTYSTEDGDVRLLVSDRAWLDKGRPKTADLDTAIRLQSGLFLDAKKRNDLGDIAYTSTGEDDFGEFPGRASVNWAQWIKHGKAFADRTGKLASDVLDVDALVRLAGIIPSDATPGDLPAAIAPGEAAAPLIGSWTLTGLESPIFGFDTTATMTATFDAEGRVTRSFECKRRKGAKPATISDLYFLEGDRIMTVSGGQGPAGEECASPPSNPIAFIETLHAFDPLSASREATWTIDGDTLTIAIERGPIDTLTFTRAAG